jgi:hypothetical protein
MGRHEVLSVPLDYLSAVSTSDDSAIAFSKHKHTYRYQTLSMILETRESEPHTDSAKEGRLAPLFVASALPSFDRQRTIRGRPKDGINLVPRHF